MAVGAARIQSIRLLATSVLFWLASAALAKEGVVVEGFEDPEHLSVTGGKITVVESGEGVTEGRRAGQLSPGAALRLRVASDDCRDNSWLMIDTLTVQPLMQAFRIELQDGDGFHYSATAYVRPGKDSLALPLSLPASHLSKGWPQKEEKFTLLLTNASDSAIILDNIRLTPAEGPSAGCVALDFGPKGQIAWPGFQGLGEDNRYLSWIGKRSNAGADRQAFPDPLCQDYVGPWPNSHTSDTLQVVGPGAGPLVAWMWVTHYGRSGTQPMDYSLKLNGQSMMGKKLDRRAMLGPDGLLEGMGEEWTPNWFDTKYVPRHVELLRLNLVSGKSVIELENCQIAGLVMGPTSQEKNLTPYVEKVKADLSRFHRQFVVGFREDDLCMLQPTTEEETAGAILLQPREEEAFGPTWKPKEDRRAKTLRAVACDGGLAVVPLAVVPLSAAGSLTASLTTLKTSDGRVLHSAQPPEAFFVGRIPRVRDGRVEFQPWILTRKLGPLKERQIVYLALLLQPAETSGGGVFQGTLKLLLDRATVQIPLELEVVDAGPDLDKQAAPTAGAIGSPWVGQYYFAASDDLPEAQQDALTAKIDQTLFLQARLNALTASGPSLSSSLAVRDADFVRALKNYPPAAAPGNALVSLDSVFSSLSYEKIRLGSPRFQESVGKVIGRINALAGRSNLHRYSFYVGSPYDADSAREITRKAAVVTAAGGRAAMRAGAWNMNNSLTAGEKDSLFGGCDVLVLEPDAGEVGEIISRFKHSGEGKQYYTYEDIPDRFATGFYPAATGADGFYLGGFSPPPRVYGGFDVNGKGLLVCEEDGGFSPTLAALKVWRGIDDFVLMRRCEALVKKAKAANADAGELENVLAEIKNKVLGLPALQYDYDYFRTKNVPPGDLETWRENLIHAAGHVSAKLKR